MIDYADTFLDKADGLKYRMYAQLSKPESNNVTVADLSKQLGIGYQAAYNIFQELLDDLMGLTEMTRGLLRKEVLRAAPLPVSLDDYKAHLVQRSLLLSLIDYALNDPHPTHTQFCTDHFISRSTLLRCVRPFNQLGERFGVHLQTGRMQFFGQELNIRYYLYTIYWWAYHGTKWPFATVDQEQIANEAYRLAVVPQVPIARSQSLFFLAVAHIRLGKGQHLETSALLVGIHKRAQMHGHRSVARLPALEISAYRYFQVGALRFDSPWRQPEELRVERELLGDPALVRVAERLGKVMCDQRPLPEELAVNCLRLVFGFALFQGEYPMATVLKANRVPDDPQLCTALTAVLDTLPEDAAYTGLLQAKAALVAQLLPLAAPYRPKPLPAVPVTLRIDPSLGGYHQLLDLCQGLPRLVRLVDHDAKLIIATSHEARQAQVAHEAPYVLEWYPEAMQLVQYRDQLMATILQAHSDPRGHTKKTDTSE